MTDKKVFSLILLPLLGLTLILGLLVLNSPVSAAKEAGAPAQAGLSAWNPLHNALATTRGADGLAPVVSAPAAPEVCTPDVTPMLSYWPLDETSGTDFADVVGGNPGACTDPNCPAPGEGIVVGGQQFVASDAPRITITESAVLEQQLRWENGDSFSFEVWVKFSQNCSTSNRVFFGRYRAGSTPEAQWWLGCKTDGVTDGLPVFQMKDSTPTAAVSTVGTEPINDGLSWHHVVGVRDGSTGENLLYVDGALAASQAVAYTGSFVSTGPITMGYYAGNYQYEGLLDEVAVYDKALSATEVAAHYNAGAGQSYCSEPPVAADDALETDEGTDLPFTADDLLANDSDPDGTDPTIDAIDAASTEGGMITDHLDGTYTYSPPADFSGPDTFTYTITDGSVTDTATVTVTVNAVNDAPVADNQSVTTDEDLVVNITLTATDKDLDPLTFTVVSPPTHGTLTGTAPNLTYDPADNYNGPDSFTFKATDDSLADSNVATVSITVKPVNDAPVADNQSVSTDYNTAVNITLTATDADGSSLTFTVVALPAHGTLTGTAPNLIYTPVADYHGPDSFTFKANDGTVDSNVATVTITVNPGEGILLYLPMLYRSDD